MQDGICTVTMAKHTGSIYGLITKMRAKNNLDQNACYCFQPGSQISQVSITQHIRRQVVLMFCLIGVIRNR